MMKQIGFYSISRGICWGILSIVFFMFGCSRESVCGLDGFTDISALTIKDTIELEDKNILNPHHIYYKDSFLIFTTLRGQREIQLLNLFTEKVTEYNVIGQGRNEMSGYHTVRTNSNNMYLFADNRSGKIYRVCLDSLRDNPDVNYELLFKFPIEKGRRYFRFIDMPKYMMGIGMLTNGRFGIFNKETGAYEEQMKYPENKEIASLDDIYKGVLFSRTLMDSDSEGKRIVSSCFGLVEFYSLSDDGELALVRTNHYHFPLFETGSGGQAIIFKKEDKVGITGMCTDENFVYALYSDKTVGEFGEGAYNASYLLIWDWNGNPIKACELPVALYGFAVDGNTIYGLSREESPIVYVLDLDSGEFK